MSYDKFFDNYHYFDDGHKTKDPSYLVILVFDVIWYFSEFYI